MKRALLILMLALVSLGSLRGRADAVPLERLPGAGRIDIRYEPGLEQTARQLAANAEDVLIRISADLVDLPVPQRIRVQLVADASSLAAVAPQGRGAPPWAIGVAYPDLG